VKVQFEVIGPVKAAALLCSLEPAASVPPDQERRVKVELPDVGEPPPVETLLAHLEAENMQKEIDGMRLKFTVCKFSVDYSAWESLGSNLLIAYAPPKKLHFFDP
jgi:hypothetical protein